MLARLRKAGADRVMANGRDPVLDGVRGIAIIVVLFHHLVYSSGIDRHVWLDLQVFRLAQSSWIGVDLFFVLSGFLITGILYDSKKSVGYFRKFYARRALRIFPLYYGFLLLAVLLFPRWLPPESGQALQDSQAWYWLYICNFRIALDGWQEPTHLDHFWSLAVEEQFYLIWPMVVWALDRRQLIKVAGACFLGALALRATVIFDASPLATYVLLATRMDALAAGALVALMIRGSDGKKALGRWPERIFVCSTVVVALLFLRQRRLDYWDPWVGTIGYSAVAASFASLIAMAGSSSHDALLRRAVALPLLIWFGRYSYGLYVFHVPIINFLKDAGLNAGWVPRLWGSSLPGVVAFSAIGALLSVTCAVASFHMWETPFLKLRSRYRGTRKSTTFPPPSLVRH